MNTERVILQKKLREFSGVEAYFERLSGIDPDHVPEKYGSWVGNARALAEDHLEIAMVYKCEDIERIGEKEVVLESGMRYTGDMPPRILEAAEQVVCYVITLRGYKELAEGTEDVMEQYFLDTWGSAYVECAQAWLGTQIREELRKEGKTRTHLWSPGQHQFELSNQHPIFAILHPEEIGCVLTKSLMMVPVKSTSGIIGVVPEGTGNLLLPCDFCPFGAKCPASKKGCSAV